MPSISELYPEVREGDEGVVTGQFAIPMGARVRVEVSPTTGRLSVAYNGLNWSYSSGKHFKFWAKKPEKKGYAKWVGGIE